jgi:hypothetical protein
VQAKLNAEMWDKEIHRFYVQGRVLCPDEWMLNVAVGIWSELHATITIFAYLF